MVSNNGQQYFALVRNPIQATSSEATRLHLQHEAARLAVLWKMGLAESSSTGTWLIRRDFEQILRAMQRAADRQKTLARFGALISDERLPMEVLDLSRMTTVEGRVLVQGDDEQSGRNYLILESTDAKVYFVHYTPEMEEARSRGEIAGQLPRSAAQSSRGRTVVSEVQDLGNAESLLSSSWYVDHTTRKIIKRGIMPTADGWGGWLGRYQAALAEKAIDLTRGPNDALGRKHEGKRQQERSLGR